MASDDDLVPGFETLACRAGQEHTAEQEQSEPLFLTSSFRFKNAAEAAARFAEREPGNVYSRFTNPTVRCFEERLAALEGGERAIGTASGMSAILATCMSLLEAGDHIVSSASIFGTTVNLFNRVLSRFGVETSFVPLSDIAAWRNALEDRTRLLFLETPSNPLTEVADIAAIAAVAREAGALLIVDNCFCTPSLQQPLALGADLIIHSATKYLDGQGRCVGGAVVGPRELLEGSVLPFLRTAGPAMSPFNAWVFLKGLETLSLRMRAHSAGAGQVAAFLADHPGIETVNYPGLADHPQHALARAQQSDFGGIVSFVVPGGQAAAWKLIDRLKVFSITANLGDAKSTVTHPATTTHGRLSADQRQAMGIGEGLVRLSVGLETAADLVADLDRALAPGAA